MQCLVYYSYIMKMYGTKTKKSVCYCCYIIFLQEVYTLCKIKFHPYDETCHKIKNLVRQLHVK
jgi:ATP/ADP translocase